MNQGTLDGGVWLLGGFHAALVMAGDNNVCDIWEGVEVAGSCRIRRVQDLMGTVIIMDGWERLEVKPNCRYIRKQSSAAFRSLITQ